MVVIAGLIVFYKYGIMVFNIFDRDLNRVALRVAGGHGERETSRSFELDQ